MVRRGILAAKMSQNVEQAKRAADAYNRRDIAALLEELHPDVEWSAALTVLLGGEETVYRGHEGVRELLRETDDVLDEINVEYSEIRDLGDRVVAIGRIRIRGKASGATTESAVGVVSDLLDGKAVRVRTYLDPREALEAAGLSE
jgi:ketosteroid isomerase-like protein